MTVNERNSQQGNERKQTEQKWGGASDGFVRRLTLGFDTEMLTNVAKSGFHWPTGHEEGQELLRGERQVGG